MCIYKTFKELTLRTSKAAPKHLASVLLPPATCQCPHDFVWSWSFPGASCKQFTTALMMTLPTGMAPGWTRMRRTERTDATDDEDDYELRLRVRVPLWSSWLCPSHLAPKTLFQFPLSTLAISALLFAFRNYVFGWKSCGALCEKSESFQRLRNVA